MRRIRRDSSVTASSARARRLRARRPRCASVSLGELTELGARSRDARVTWASQDEVSRAKGGVHLSRFERSRLYHVHRAAAHARGRNHAQPPTTHARNARAARPEPGGYRLTLTGKLWHKRARRAPADGRVVTILDGQHASFIGPYKLKRVLSCTFTASTFDDAWVVDLPICALGMRRSEWEQHGRVSDGASVW